MYIYDHMNYEGQAADRTKESAMRPRVNRVLSDDTNLIVSDGPRTANAVMQELSAKGPFGAHWPGSVREPAPSIPRAAKITKDQGSLAVSNN
jgi:hypothetical protein